MLSLRLLAWLLRVIRGGAACLGYAVVLSLTTLLGALLHLNTGASQRLVRGEVHQLLDGLFEGTIRIESIDSISLGGVRGVNLSISTPDGAEVLRVWGLSAKLQTRVLLSSLVEGEGPLQIVLSDASVERVHSEVKFDEAGNLRLVSAFEPRPSDAPEPTAPGRPVLFEIQRLGLGRAWAYGSAPGVEVLDLEISKLSGRFQVLASEAGADTELGIFFADILARSLPLALDPRGNLSAGLTITAREGLSAHANYSGAVAGLELTLNAHYGPEALFAELLLPRFEGRDLAAFGVPLREQTRGALQLVADGPLNDLIVEGRLRLDQAELHLSGAASAELPAALVGIRLSKADLSAFEPSLPETQIDASLLAYFSGETNLPWARAKLNSERFRFGDWVVPELHASAELSEAELSARLDTREGTNSVWASVRGSLPKEPADALGEQTLHFEARAALPTLRSLQTPGLSLPLRGDLSLSAQGSARADFSQLRADISVSSSALAGYGASLRGLRISASVSGAPSQPQLGARATFGPTRYALAGEPPRVFRFSRGELSLAGDLNVLQVKTKWQGTGLTPSVQLSSGLRLAPRVELTRLSASILRGEQRLDVRAQRIAPAGSSFVVNQLEVSGAAELKGSVRLGWADLESEAQIQHLDLKRLQGLLGVDLGLAGQVSGALSLRGPLKALAGKLDLSLRQVRYEQFELTGDTQINILDGNASGGGNYRVVGVASGPERREELGSIALSVEELAPRGSFIEPKAWGDAALKASADFNIRADRLQAHLKERLPQDYLVSGSLRGQLLIERASGEALPKLNLRWSSTGLELARGALGVRAKAASSPFISSGVDGRGTLQVDGSSGDTAVQLELTSAGSRLLNLALKSKIPYDKILAKSVDLTTFWKRLPLELQLVATNLDLQNLPEPLRPGQLDGQVSLSLSASGRVDEPTLRGEITASRLGVFGVRRQPRFSTRVRFGFRGGRGNISLGVSSGNKSIARGRVDAKAVFAELLEGQYSSIRADAHLMLDSIDLARVPYLQRYQASGALSAELKVSGLEKEHPAVSASAQIVNGKLGRSEFKSLELGVEVGESSAEAKLLLAQPTGAARVEAKLPVIWEGSIPRINTSGTGHMKLRATEIELALAEPFLLGPLSELDGRLNADADLSLASGGSELKGSIGIRDGSVQIPQLGQRFTSINAIAKLEPGGKITIRDASLRGATGEARLDASAQMDGLKGAGAKATLKVPSPIPLSYDGISLGQVKGELGLETKLDLVASRADVRVDVKRLELELPAQPRAGVQSLDDDPHIRIGTRRAAGFLPLPVQPTQAEEEGPVASAFQTRVQVELGQVEIKQGTLLKVALDGRILVDSTQADPISGQINIPSGRIDISGKLFQIEEGVITFQDDPSNPIVVATAAWEAADGHKVFAEYTGPVQNGTLRLRAEPSLSQNEILSLILFGSPDGSFGGGSSSSSASTAAGVGGGVATAALNRALADLTAIDVSTRIDTSDAQNPRPELVVQISPRVSAQLGYNLEEPKPGKSPDRTLFSLEFRLARRWSLATTFGDAGSSLVDLLWRYRY